MNRYEEIRENLYPIGVNLTEIYAYYDEIFCVEKAFYYDFDKIAHELVLKDDGYSAGLCFSQEDKLSGCPCSFYISLNAILLLIDELVEPHYITPLLIHNTGQELLKVKMWRSDECWEVEPGASKLIEPRCLEYYIGRHEKWPAFRKKDFKRFIANCDFYLQDADVYLSIAVPSVPLYIGDIRYFDISAFENRLGYVGKKSAGLYLYIDEKKAVIRRSGCDEIWLTDEENKLMYEAMNEFIKEFRRMNITFDGYVQKVRERNK